jgi:hypothetical protein
MSRPKSGSAALTGRVDGWKKILHLLALILWKRLHPFPPEPFGLRRILVPLANIGDIVVDHGPAVAAEAEIFLCKLQAWGFGFGAAITI